MRDELNEPLGQARPRTPLRARLRPLGVWSRRVAVTGLALGAVALYWRATAPRPAEVAVIPFDAITSVTPTPTPSAASPQVSVYPPANAAVSVVRKGVTGGANGHGPEIIEVGEALGHPAAVAVEARLVEPSKYGPLPRIAADGARPSAVYARPFAETPLNHGAPRIAVLVGGVGLDSQTTEAAISRLPAAVSLGLAPYGPELAKVAMRARAAGHEIWLQAPMEGVAGADPGPHTLKSDASSAQNEDSLRWLMARFTGYVGIENYLGAKYTADANAVSPTLAEIARRGLLYLDDGSSALSKVGDLAAGLDLKAGKADVIAVGDPAAIDAALAQAEDIARRGGAAILVASALPSTLDHLAPWARGLEAKGFAFAPVSALTIARPDRAARANP